VAVVWTTEGADDFLTAVAYLHEQNPAAASKLAARTDEALQRLDELPLEGPETRLRGGAVVRSWPIPPFRAYYVRRDDDVLVLRFYDQRRDPIARP
jgi:plasmid stabilization system protein ParE